VAYRLVERGNLARASLIHASSLAEARGIEAHRLGVPVAVVPNGVEVPAGAARPPGAVRHRLRLPPGAPLIVYLGRVHPSKRLDLLARAFGRVQAVAPSAHLVVAGPDELGHRRAVEPAFGASAPRVCWTGELDDEDKWALLAEASALVMCSDSESFGMSVLEALAAGVPVVVARTCPWPEVAEHGCGYWVPQEPDALADGMLRLLGDPAAARAMGARGARLARERYSWDSVARAMAEHYESVLARAARATAAP
jgi:glycosyltransferase involved in cell wall biosynthesis